jgi:nucleotide-binding universal stress UspA family protein
MYKQILVPTDGSEISARAVKTAAGLARLFNAKLEVLSVREPFPYSAISEIQPIPPQEFYDAQERLATSRVEAAIDAARTEGIKAEGATVEALHPWEAVLEQAKAKGCDLIVMASHGRRGLGALLLGSETQKVLTHSTLPVLVIR